MKKKKQIKKLQEDDIIKNSISHFNSPVIFVHKTIIDEEGNKKLRMCVDYREKQAAPTPHERLE